MSNAPAEELPTEEIDLAAAIVVRPSARQDRAVGHDSLPLKQVIDHPLPVQAKHKGIANVFILEERQ